MARAKKKTKTENRNAQEPVSVDTTEVHVTESTEVPDEGLDFSLDSLTVTLNLLSQFMDTDATDSEETNPTRDVLFLVQAVVMNLSRLLAAQANKAEAEARIAKIKADFLTRNAKNTDNRLFQSNAHLSL